MLTTGKIWTNMRTCRNNVSGRIDELPLSGSMPTACPHSQMRNRIITTTLALTVFIGYTRDKATDGGETKPFAEYLKKTEKNSFRFFSFVSLQLE